MAWALRLLCPRDGYQTFARVYAYFRWVDDWVDVPDRALLGAAAFVRAQAQALGQARPGAPEPERALGRVRSDPVWWPRIESAVRLMLEALAFDAARGREPQPEAAIEAQIARVGDAYLAAVWACSGAPGRVPAGLLPLARGATRAHLVRDQEIDAQLGYCNVPAERVAGASPTAEELAAWSRDFAGRAARELASGRAALGLAPWRTRLLLTLYAWKYARLAQRLIRSGSPASATAG
jgi:phytoene/squalene synthetase